MPWAKLQFSLLLLGVYANRSLSIYLKVTQWNGFSPVWRARTGGGRERPIVHLSPNPCVCGCVYGACGIFQRSKWTISSVLVHYNTLQLCGQEVSVIKVLFCALLCRVNSTDTLSIDPLFRTSLAFREQSHSGSGSAILVSLAKKHFTVCCCNWCLILLQLGEHTVLLMILIKHVILRKSNVGNLEIGHAHYKEKFKLPNRKHWTVFSKMSTDIFCLI